MCLFKFLKNYTGIIFTQNYLSLPNEMEVSNNKAKYSQLDVALERVKIKPKSIHKYLNTIQNGMEYIDNNIVKEFKSHLINGCQNSGINLTPSEKYPICDINVINTMKMLNKCYIDGEKAKGVKEFPGKLYKKVYFQNFQLFSIINKGVRNF